MFKPPFGELLPSWFKKHKQAAPTTRTRFHLSAPQNVQLQTALATLLATNVLRADDVTFEELVERAETLDDYSARDCSEAKVIFDLLNTVQSKRRRFHNLVFVADQVEVDAEGALEIVREFARLAGQADQLGELRLRGIDGGTVVPARRGELPPDNALIEFELGARRCALPFVMYGKNIPLGLMETLPELLLPADPPRRFFSAYFDAFLAVTLLSADQVATLNLAFAHQPDCFELLK